MKNIRIYGLVLCSFFALLSCVDDGGIMDEAPGETLKGTLTDSETGNTYLTGEETHSFDVILKEISFADNAPERKYKGMFEGTYQNTKLFNAEYSIEIKGPFLPVPIETVKVSGTVVQDFTVTPFTHFNGVSASKSGTNITVKFTHYQTTTAGGYPNDIRVLVGRYVRVSHSTFEFREILRPNSAESDAMLGVEQSVTLSSDKIDPSLKYYARIATSTSRSGYWNFSEVVEVN